MTNLADYYINPAFWIDLSSDLFKVDSFEKIAIFMTAITTERDFKSEYSFGTCSIVTNLVNSLEFKPIDCVTMLCLFGRKRNGYVATHSILLSSTAESSATSGYVVVPERFGQNEEPAIRNEDRTKKKPSFVPSGGFNRCNM